MRDWTQALDTAMGVLPALFPRAYRMNVSLSRGYLTLEIAPQDPKAGRLNEAFTILGTEGSVVVL